MEEAFVAMEDDLQNLFVMIDALKQIEFELEFVDIAAQIAKNTSNIDTPIFEILGRSLVPILEKNDSSIDIYFELFYYWCYNH